MSENPRERMRKRPLGRLVSILRAFRMPVGIPVPKDDSTGFYGLLVNAELQRKT